MKGRIGTKVYDTEKATFIEALPDGIEVYRKTGRSTEFFLYNPQGDTAKTRFCDLPAEQAEKYLGENTRSKMSTNKSNTIRFRPYDIERIRRLALQNNMPMNNFVMMLVEIYERTHK